MSGLQLLGSLELGFVYGIVALGVYLTFRVIDFADMTVDGSFPLGAAIAATLISNQWNPYIATGIAFLGGAIAGIITGILNARFKIIGLLAGILTMTALYSVNLRIMGRPNIALFDQSTIFGGTNNVLILGILIFVLWLLLMRFLRSEFGLGMRAVGMNPRVSRSYGINVNFIILFTLGLSNGLVAIAGAVFAQSQGFADISMGTGTVVVGLASVILGETLLHSRNITVALFSCVFGSVLYRIAIAFALNSGDFGLRASDLNLITAALVACTMIIPQLKKKVLKAS